MEWLNTALTFAGGVLTLATGQYVIKRWKGIKAPAPERQWTEDERAAEKLRAEMRAEEDRERDKLEQPARAKDP